MPRLIDFDPNFPRLHVQILLFDGFEILEQRL